MHDFTPAHRLRCMLLAACLSMLAACQIPAPSTALPPAPPVVADFTIKSRDTDVPVTWVVPQPEAVRGASMPLAILIHGHGGTRHEASSFARLGLQLADAGIASIRMDFPGSGDSTEPFYNNNLRNMLTDVRNAERFAFSHADIDPSRIGLVGFSMGGRVAALLSESDGNIDTMVLWAPALENGAGSIVKMLGGNEAYAAARSLAIEQGYATFTTSWGQEQQLGPEWFEDMQSSRPMDAISRYGGALMFVHGSDDAVVPVDVSRNAAKAAQSAREVELHIIDGADHGFGLFSDNDRYSAELVAQTVSFLEREL